MRLISSPELPQISVTFEEAILSIRERAEDGCFTIGAELTSVSDPVFIPFGTYSSMEKARDNFEAIHRIYEQRHVYCLIFSDNQKTTANADQGSGKG